MAQKINVKVIGITHMKGTSKATGNAYEFSQLDYLRPAQQHFKNDKTEIRKAGYEVKQIGFSSDPAVFSELSLMPFGESVTLILEPDPKDIQKSIVISFERMSKPN